MILSNDIIVSMKSAPPFLITRQAQDTIDAILELIGRYQTATAMIRPELLRHNRNRSVQASLSIEGNTLSLEDVSAIAAGVRPPSAQPRDVTAAVKVPYFAALSVPL